MPSNQPNSLCQWHEKAAKLALTPAMFRKSVKEQEQQQKVNWPLWPKIVQVNKTDIHILGGRVHLAATDAHYMTKIE
jgi:hypothetical protein